MPQERNRLRQVRLSEGLKVTELARFSGVSERTIREIEKERASSTEVTKYKIVRGLNENPAKNQSWSYEEVFDTQ